MLRAQRDAGGLLGGQGESFVVGIGVQRLRAAENRSHGLNCGADNIVFGLLRGQRGPGGLSMKAQHPGTGIFGFEMFAHDASPHAAGGAKLGHFLQKIAVRVEEKRKPRRELIHIKAGVDRGLHVRDAHWPG